MNIHDLAAEVGESPRQIRYLIAERCIPSHGGTRSNPVYGQEHVAAIRRFQLLRKQNRISEIRAILIAEGLAREGGRVELAPGVELLVDAVHLVRASLDPKQIGGVVTALLTDILKNIQSKENENDA